MTTFDRRWLCPCLIVHVPYQESGDDESPVGLTSLLPFFIHPFVHLILTYKHRNTTLVNTYFGFSLTFLVYLLFKQCRLCNEQYQIQDLPIYLAIYSQKLHEIDKECTGRIPITRRYITRGKHITYVAIIGKQVYLACEYESFTGLW